MLSELDPSALGLPNQPDSDEESDPASDDLEEDIGAWERSQTWLRRRPSHEIEALFLRRGYIRLSDMYVELTDELTDDDPPESPPSNELSKDPLEMMSRLTALLREYLVCSDAQLTILALWIVHTHCFIHSTVTPYLDIYSAERQCGKTICLQLLHALCAEPWLATAPSAFVLSQKVLGATPTVLVDDRHISLASERQSVIGLLTNGCRRDLPYTVWRQGRLLQLNAFSPKAFAGLGRLQPSLADRSIPIRLERKRPADSVKRLIVDHLAEEASPLLHWLECWALDAANPVRESSTAPLQLRGLSPRQSDCAEPLVSVALALGGPWPEKIAAALAAVFSVLQPELGSDAIQLLSDVRDAFIHHNHPEQLPTRELLAWLSDREDRPWSRWPKKSAAQRLGCLLWSTFQISSRKLREDTHSTPWGYRKCDFLDAWQRYLPPWPDMFRGVPEQNHAPEQEIPSNHAGCAAVPG